MPVVRRFGHVAIWHGLSFLSAFLRVEVSMKTRRLLSLVLVALVSFAAGCSDSPTESSSVPTSGNLVINLTQPCPLTGTVSAFAGNTPLGTLVVPGNNTFSVPAGSYSLSFLRGQEVFGASGQVRVPAGGTTVVTDPPAACMATSGAH
jgi:hypothetical protein